MRKTTWWQVFLIVYGAAGVGMLIEDRFLSHVIAASLAGLAVELIVTWTSFQKRKAG